MKIYVLLLIASSVWLSSCFHSTWKNKVPSSHHIVQANFFQKYLGIDLLLADANQTKMELKNLNSKIDIKDAETKAELQMINSKIDINDADRNQTKLELRSINKQISTILSGDLGRVMEVLAREDARDRKGREYVSGFTALDYVDLVMLATPSSFLSNRELTRMIRKNSVTFVDNLYRSECLFRLSEVFLNISVTRLDETDMLSRLRQIDSVENDREKLALETTKYLLQQFIDIDEDKFFTRSEANDAKKEALAEVLSSPEKNSYIFPLLFSLTNQNGTRNFDRATIFKFTEMELDMRGQLLEAGEQVVIEVVEIKRGAESRTAIRQLKERAYATALSHFLCQKQRQVKNYQALCFYYSKNGAKARKATVPVDVKVYPPEKSIPTEGSENIHELKKVPAREGLSTGFDLTFSFIKAYKTTL